MMRNEIQQSLDDGQYTPGNPTALVIQVGASLADVERQLILATLEASEGNKPRAARTLGVSLKTLYNRLNEYRQRNDNEVHLQPSRRNGSASPSMYASSMTA